MVGKRRAKKVTVAVVCDPGSAKPFSDGPSDDDGAIIRESEDKFRAVFDWAGLGIVISNSKGCIQDFNDAFQELLGYSKEELIQRPFSDVTYPDDIDKNLDLFRQMVAGKIDKFQIEKRYVRKDGRTIWCKLTVSAIREHEGTFKHSLAVVEDITERKRAEKALWDSEANLAMAQRIARLGNFSLDITEDKAQCSDEFYHILGLEPQNYFSYKQFLNYVHPEDREEFDRKTREVWDQGKSRPIEFRIVRTDGEVRFIHGDCNIIIDETGRAVRMFGILQDITERKRAEEALATARDRLAADLAGLSRLQEISTRLVLQDNLGSLLGEIIEAAIEITGADMGNIQLSKGGALKIVESRGFDRPFLDYFNSVHENEAACGTAMVKCERVIVEDVTKSPIFAGKPSLEVMLAAGARAVQSTPLFSRSGRLLGMFSTHYRTPHRPGGRELFLLDMLARQAADHIERVRGEEALKEAIQQAELYVDLMGHDINNINQSAMGYLELALQELEMEKKLKLDDKVLIERPMHALANSTALISNVRKLQKLVKWGVKTEPTDLHKIFREIEAMSFHSHDRDVLINFQQVQGIMVEANDLLKDVLFNLIANAVKHSDDEKQLIINVKAEPVDENGQKYYKIMVEDNGPGIPDEMKNKLFHRFQRGATKAHGKGLGLYIVRTLVEGYNGRVCAEDRVQGDHTKGARFVVLLPAIKK